MGSPVEYKIGTHLNETVIRQVITRTGKMKSFRHLSLIFIVPVLIRAGPPGQVFLGEPIDLVAVAGEHLMLPCSATKMEGECQWTKDGQGFGTDPTLPEFPRHTYDMDHLSDCNLLIFPVLPEDEGSYQCHVKSLLDGSNISSKEAKVIVNSPPGQPFILQAKNTDSIDIQKGDEVKLDCETTGAKPAAKIQWKDQDGNLMATKVLETVHKNEISKTFKTVSTLKMRPVRHTKLTCSAFSEDFKEPKISRELEVKVRHAPRALLNITESHVEEGEPLVVMCSSEAYPSDITYKWLINEENMDETSNVLKIEKVSKDLDKAQISCIVENSVGVTRVRAQIKVNFSPKIIVHPSSHIMRNGEVVNLKCRAKGNPEPNYIWVKGESQEVVGASKDLTLTASDETEGDYMCKIFVDGYETVDSEVASLKILRKPSVFTESVKYASLGQDVILQCHVESLSSNTKVTWTKNDEPIDRRFVKHRIIHTEGNHHYTSDLIVYKVEEEDFTNYGCFSTNEIGTDYKIFALEEEKSQLDFLILAINITGGVLLLTGILIYCCRRKNTPETKSDVEIATRQDDPPPPYTEEPPNIYREPLLTRRIQETQ